MLLKKAQDMKFYEKLQQAVAASGLKKKEVAKLAGITAVALSKYLKGEVTPKSENLTKIANALNLPLTYFYGDSDEMSSENEELEKWKARALAAESKLDALKKVLPLISEANTILSKNF